MADVQRATQLRQLKLTRHNSTLKLLDNDKYTTGINLTAVLNQSSLSSCGHIAAHDNIGISLLPCLFIYTLHGLQMMRPQIQNDFASYRRHLSRMKKMEEEGLLPQLPVADTDANGISMFIAEVDTMLQYNAVVLW